MKILKANSLEHRELIIGTIIEKDIHTLQQLKNVSGSAEIVVIDSFQDALMYSSIETEEEQHEVIRDKGLFHKLMNNDEG